MYSTRFYPNKVTHFKIVPGLGVALHEAMRKISGVEEIAPAAEGLKIFIIIPFLDS